MKVTQGRCEKYKWKKDYHFIFPCQNPVDCHICKAHELNALLQYIYVTCMSLLGLGGGLRMTVQSPVQK